ncbi:hypothetical protein GGR08_000068 [Bartonella fuyuanensis]|uniref:Uncharacterized protein n=1 Tax=Bartonella fuyuanensis TaxID=1460968 RepID=A0A840DYY9_9HYPH|nr:hypothetical protein [Bartonella fuyuanensis]MBB4075787.1 hypothetical protein [Bartonella fuyuanensis]
MKKTIVIIAISTFFGIPNLAKSENIAGKTKGHSRIHLLPSLSEDLDSSSSYKL